MMDERYEVEQFYPPEADDAYALDPEMKVTIHKMGNTYTGYRYPDSDSDFEGTVDPSQGVPTLGELFAECLSPTLKDQN